MNPVSNGLGKMAEGKQTPSVDAETLTGDVLYLSVLKKLSGLDGIG